MRRQVVLMTAAALCASATVAHALPSSSAGSKFRRLYVITTVRSGATPLEVDFLARAGGDEGFATVFAVFQARQMRSVEGVFAMEFGNQTSVRLVGGGTSRDTCAMDLATCRAGQTPGTFSFRQSGRSKIVPGLSIYIAVEASSVRLTVGPGLRARLIDGGLRRLTAESADDAGVAVGRVQAARFTEAALEGGRRGSVAVAAVPCEVEGAGRAVLAGVGTKALTCGSPQSAVASGVSSERVRWHLSGETTGVSGTRTRLAVVDLV